MSITVGVIGCGMISRFHFSGLARAGARVLRVCDLDPAKAAAWAATTGAVPGSDWREVVDDPRIDAVVVAVISRLHREICLAAIAAGKAVICEKTLATNAEDALEIVRAAEAGGRPFFTAYMKRWFEAAQQAKALLPALGRILSSHVRVHQPWGGIWDHTPSPGPSASVSNYGGGILVMGGSHVLDLTLFLIGRPSRVYGRMRTPPGFDFELQACALMETPDAGLIHFEALASPLGRSGFLRDGWDEQVEIIGTGGKLTLLTSLWNQVEQKTALLIHEDEASGQRHEFRYAPDSPFDRAIGAFVADIAAGEQRCQSRRSGYEVDQLIAAITASAHSDLPVAVDWRT